MARDAKLEGGDEMIGNWEKRRVSSQRQVVSAREGSFKAGEREEGN